MSELLDKPNCTELFPIPLQTLKNKLDMFAAFDQTELETVADHYPAVTHATHPVASLMNFRGRPELWLKGNPLAHSDPERLMRRREAYRYGVTLAASLLLRRTLQLGMDIQPDLDVDDDTVVTAEIFDAARASRRFLVRQFIDTDQDVLEMVVEHMELPALRQHMTWLTGREHEPGHHDYFHVGLGDCLAEYAIRHGDSQVETVPLA